MNILTTFYQSLVGVATNLVLGQAGGPGTTTGGTGTIGPEDVDTASAIETITTSPVWTNVIVPVSVALGVVTLIYGAWKAITSIFKGQPGEVIKTIGKTLLLAAFLFRLDLVFVIIEVTARAVGGLVESINNLIT
jgi:hypothetical protein